jgi:AmmeMemoRadiSam system protein A
VLPLTEADEQELLRLARDALEEGVRLGRLSEVEAPPGVLRDHCGAFVTLHKHASLRGCIGYVEPLKPLYKTVRECAHAAATRDPRFEPVTPEELPDLRLEISILSRLEEVSPDRVLVGQHGLLISRGFQRGLLLPQVALHFKWDRQRFLEETCLKAGLPPDAWQHGASIQVFTARVFGEERKLANSADHAA